MFDWFRRKTGRPADAAVVAVPERSTTAPPAPPRGPLAAYRAGAVDAAGQAAAERLAADASDAEAVLVQALIALDGGRALEAVKRLEQAVQQAPDQADLHVGLGRALAAAGRRPAARTALERALELDPSSGEARVALGRLAMAQGRADEALQHFQQATQADPAHADGWFHLAELVRERGKPAEAEPHLRRAIAARADHAGALALLGALLRDRGQPAEAAVLLERALKAQPDHAAAMFNLGLLRVDQRRWSEAAALLRGYVAVDPKDDHAQYWLGNASMGDGDAAAARRAYQAALRANEHHLQARWGLAMAQLPAVPQTEAEQAGAPVAFNLELTRLKTWLRSHGKVEAAQAVGAQQPYYLAYIPQNHRAVLASYGALCTSQMATWARRVGVPVPVAATGTKLRVGIVSAHLHSHSVWHAILRGWVEHLDASQFELHLFHTGGGRDAETDWAARRAKQLDQGAGDWTAWAKLISDRRLDVLVYPEIGMDATTVRLASLRLARTQLASWGHPLTTGLPTMDAFVSAAAFEPEGAQAHYTEPLITLPGLGCCYRPFGVVPTRPDLSAFGISADDRVLLCAGTPFKYAPRDDALLVDIARRCRPCKLVFFRTQNGQLSTLLEQRLRKAFDAASVPFDECVCFVPWQPHATFFGLLDRADVYLDSIGFSGFNTTMQAIERGTPVVAWEGEFLRGRFASGILRQAGLAEWVAGDVAGYAERVQRLCDDRALRDGVRGEIMARRPALFDDRATVRAFGERLAALAAGR